jgi:hypothetical protein
LITVIYFWRIKRVYLPLAILFMALHRWSIKNFPTVGFVKLLGTGKGKSFTPTDADATRWGLLVTIAPEKLSAFDNSRVIKQWRKISHSQYSAELKPISSHGLWSKKAPFEISEQSWDGKIAAITRARITWQQNFKFWRAVPPVTQSLHESAGLISAIGIGEAPIGLQGTFSIWQDAKSLREFAYKGQAHAKVIADTAANKWYAEELFARFAIIKESGQLL